jgi:hypothetical protein
LHLLLNNVTHTKGNRLTYKLIIWYMVVQPVSIFYFYGTRKFNQRLTGLHSEPAESRHPIYLRLILSSHLQLGLPSGLIPSGFETTFTFPVHIILYFIRPDNIRRKLQTMKLLCMFFRLVK